MFRYLSLAFLVLQYCPLTASQNLDTFQCGDGNFSFTSLAENGKECPCSTVSFLEFVNLGCPIPYASTTIQNDTTIYLAGLLDLTSYWWASDIFNVTVDLYNQGFFTHVNGVPMKNRLVAYELADSKCDETETIRAYWQLRTENNDVPPDGVVGTRCSGPTEALARQLGVEGVPQVSPGASSAKLSDNGRYPEFSRLVAPQDERGEAAAMVALLRSFGWDQIGILASDKSFSLDWATSLKKLWLGPHNDETGVWNGEVLHTDTISLDSAGKKVDEESIRQSLENFPKNKVRVIVLLAHESDAFPILKAAIGMEFQPDTIWVGPASWVGRDDLEENLAWLTPGVAPGWIGFTPYRNKNSYAQAFKEQMDSFLALEGRQPWENLPVYAAETVDSIVLLAYAIDVAKDQPGGGNATSILRNLSYESGISGLVELTDQGDRAASNFTVLSMGTNGEWREIGTSFITPTSASADVQIEKICWASYGCALHAAPGDTYPQPKVKLPIWSVALFVIFVVALMALALKYWLSRRSKKRMKNELSKFQKSVVGMRAAKMTYIPSNVLADDTRRSSIESRASQRISSMMLSASLQSSGSGATKAQWCWKETPGHMNQHDSSQVYGAPSACWIKYDDYYNTLIETAFQHHNRKDQVSLDPLDYIVNLETETQTRNSTGFVRKIIRFEEATSRDTCVTSGIDSVSTIAQCPELPHELQSDPQMVLVEGDVIKVSEQRSDGWAFGTKLFHADEEIVRELVKFATLADDAEKCADCNLCADTGWFPIDWATRPPTADDLAGLQKNVSDTGELEAPTHWDPVKDALLVQRHNLDENCQEYQQVSSAFLSTLKERVTKLISIERIQNMGMWQSYVVKRQTICYREAKLDRQQVLQRFERRWLWHGTNSEVFEKIIQQGFNRSFCGKNATVWGKGVYFAHDAEYSSRDTYSVPDKKGIKHVIACRVMVGEYCKGKQDAITPDVRCPKTHSLYDSTVDRMHSPELYVTYHDAQAYPEYIIRFKFLD